jgi:hypothetical protein
MEKLGWPVSVVADPNSRLLFEHRQVSGEPRRLEHRGSCLAGQSLEHCHAPQSVAAMDDGLQRWGSELDAPFDGLLMLRWTMSTLSLCLGGPWRE